MAAGDLLDGVPFVATAFAVPQFLPQLAKLRATGDTAGVSWAWSALTSVNNAAWLAYFARSGYTTALVPSCSATVLAATLAVTLTRHGGAAKRPALLIGGWATLLTVAATVGGVGALGVLLTGAFALQVSPSLWTAYRTDWPTGISRGTWALVLGELSCWTVFGVHRSDPRLIVLGITGIVASTLMLARTFRAPGWRSGEITVARRRARATC
jgi:hypothetical protein